VIDLYRNPVKRRFELAGDRLLAAFARDYLRSFRTPPPPPRPPELSAQERADIARFSTSDSFSDRTRRFKFEARDPRTGRLGQVDVSVNSLLLIEASYDDAKTQLTRLLDQLTGPNGPLTYDRPAAPPDVRRFQDLNPSGQWSGDRGPVVSYGGYGDQRIVTGAWADFPRYAGLVNDNYDMAATAFGYTPFTNGNLLPGVPLPVNWRRIYAKERLWDRRDFSDDAFVGAMNEMGRLMVLLSHGANANIEWSPGAVLFLNGVEPAFHSGGVWDSVDLRYQYKNYHPYFRVTRAMPVQSAGLVPAGRSDPLWLSSLRARAPRAQEESRRPTTSHNWGSQDYADAVGNLVQLANACRFMLDIGATAHVNAALEYHAALCKKAYRELELAEGAGLQGYLAEVARERAARAERALASSGVGGAGMQLVQGVGDGGVRDTWNAILNGATVASMQLFAASPLIGGIAAGITGLAILITNLVLGPRFECRGDLVLIRDGITPVRTEDEMGCQGRDGDCYGGNRYPHRRGDAISGRPCIRVRDAYGREL